MTYADSDYDEYDEYDDYYNDEDDYYDDYDENGQFSRQAVDWGVSGSILAIILLTVIYVCSPVDFVPDVMPVAGQADDIAAVIAGGGSVVFLTIARYVMNAVMGSRIGRWGCLIVVVLTLIGAATVFWTLLQFFDSIF
jgi:hypothetical protein